MKDFVHYMVWNPLGSAPRYLHSTFDDARREAERLATQNPGNRFLVLKIVGQAYVEKPTSFTAFQEKDEVPF